MSDTHSSKTFGQKDTLTNPSSSFIFFLGRAQKIATALYLITSLIKDKEPLREELRKRALELLSSIRTLSDNAVVNVQLLDEVRRLLEHAMALSGLASRTGLISIMNHDFLHREIESFVNDLTSSFAEKEGASLIETSIKDAEVPLASSLLLAGAEKSYKGHSKGQHKGHAVLRIKRTTSPAFGEFKEMRGPIKDVAPLNAGGAERKEKIYRIIQEKGSLTIKDIAQVAPQFSEKTIQRDLVEMVSGGKVKKKGERRWTVYFI